MDLEATINGQTALDIAKKEANMSHFDPCGHTSQAEFDAQRKHYSKIVEYLESKPKRIV